MFDARRNGLRVRQIGRLQSAHRGRSQGARQLWILGETFVRASPTHILRHGHTGRERPVDPRRAYFLCCDSPDLLHQIRIASTSERDVLREDHRPQHVVVTMHRVDAVQQRNAQTRAQCRLLAAIVHGGPGLAAVALLRIRITATQDRTDIQLLNIVQVFDEILIGLRHLPDFFIQRHAGDNRLNLLIKGGQVDSSRVLSPSGLRPTADAQHKDCPSRPQRPVQQREHGEYLG